MPTSSTRPGTTLAVVSERNQQQHGATISWSTNGATGSEMAISDAAATSVAGLPSSVFDSFDLVRIDPITAALDPRLQYDQITGSSSTACRRTRGSTPPTTLPEQPATSSSPATR